MDGMVANSFFFLINTLTAAAMVLFFNFTPR
jgi:hypothetical protein